MMKTKRTAFTLIELLVVIAIIGVLATLIVTQIGNARTRANNARAKSDILSAGKAVALFSGTFGSILAATQTSVGADRFTINTPLANPFSLPVAEAVLAPPTKGDYLDSNNYMDACNNPFLNMFNSKQAPFYYGATLQRVPSTFYTYEYRTTDTKAVVNGGNCPTTIPNHQMSAFPDYTLITNLDVSDGSTDYFYWVNDGSPGSGTIAAGTGIPAP